MFEKGLEYSRKKIGDICYPGVGRPKGGQWDTGYVRPAACTHASVAPSFGENDLIIFANFDVAGRTGHDFPNHYDEESQIISWFGKPLCHSNQPIFERLIRGESTLYFFGRWDDKADFRYFGIANYVEHRDGVPIIVEGQPSQTIRVMLKCQDVDHGISSRESEENVEQSFAMEKHLEEFIVDNWISTEFGKSYDIYDEDPDRPGQQFPTDTGRIDILALSKDKESLLVLELKKGRASDAAVGQILRYINFVQEEIAKPGQSVKGVIIALDDDQRIRRALDAVTGIDFYRYRISFDLVKA